MTPRISFHSEGGWSEYHPFPYLDVVELPDGYLIQVELAGVNPEAVTVKVIGDSLVIEGERTPDYPDGARKVLRMEMVYGGFHRLLLLPPDADPSNITARWSQGMLRVKVPRKMDSHRVDIEVEG